MDTLTFSTILNALSTNFWIAILAIFVFFLWKSTPKLYEIYEKHLKSKADEISKISIALESNANGLSNGLGKISEAIHSFEKAFLGLDMKISEMKGEILEIKTELKDELVFVRERLSTYPPNNNILPKIRKKTDSTP